MEIALAVLLGAIFLFGIVGWGWLLFRRCKITLVQLLAAIFSYGLMLALLKTFLEGEAGMEAFPFLAIGLSLAVGMGIRDPRPVCAFLSRTPPLLWEPAISS